MTDATTGDAKTDDAPTLNGKPEASLTPALDAAIPAKPVEQAVFELAPVQQPTSIARDEPILESATAGSEDVELNDAPPPISSDKDDVPEPPLNDEEMDISQSPANEEATAETQSPSVKEEASSTLPIPQTQSTSAQQPSTSTEPSSISQPITTSFPSDPVETMPSQPSGQVRPREDESDGEPSAKRPKMDEMDVDIIGTTADASTPAVETSTPSATVAMSNVDYDSNPMTKYQQKYLVEAIRKAKKIKAAAAFLLPVDPIALNIPKYIEIITHPMDLGTMEERLKADKYATANELWSDFEAMVQNSITFNGQQHAVSQAGLSLKAYFAKLMQQMPKGDAAKGETKKEKPPPAAPVRQVPPRRESRMAARSPVAAKPPPPPPTPKEPEPKPQLDAYGTPLIRRESQVDRPKREIVKPVRDLPYTTAKPKKKNARLDLRFCEYVNKEIFKPKYKNYNWPFTTPVDTVALNIPQYHRIVKKPMDFGSIAEKLKEGAYTNAKQYYEDAKLVFTNCYVFNAPGDNVHQMGKQLEAAFDDLWAKKEQWIIDNAPPSEPASEEEESEEEDVEEARDDQMQRMLEIQRQIAALSAEAMALSSGQPAKELSKKTKTKDRSSTGTSKKQKRSSLSASSKPPKTKKPKKSSRKLTLDEKRYVSEGIAILDEPNMRKAVQIIRNGVPALKVSV
jgi:bromodomain-containing factor 1